MALLTALILTGCNDSSTKKGTEQSTPPDSGTPSDSSNLESAFPLHTSVFGVSIRATKETNKEKVLHAANVMAQYLDNDEDGVPDNQAVVDKLVENGATLIMAPTDNELESAVTDLTESDSWQALYGDETILPGESDRFDGSLEEVLHLITHVGYSRVYPEVFGEKMDSSIADAMDLARGGRFETTPTTYPDNAWYTYDDETCDYSCMVTEYTYLALTSILGAQKDRLEEIGNEWKLNTREKVEQQDPAIFAILTNPEYALANQIPNGNYTAIEFTLEGEGVSQEEGADESSEILQSAVAGNPDFKIAFTNQSKIFMMNPDATEVVELADASPIAGYVSWGPEAQFVYFASAKGPAESSWEAFRVNVQTKELEKLTMFGQDVRSLGVSPDGNYLAISIMSGNSNIGNNNNNLTQYHTNLYIIDMDSAESKWANNELLELSDMTELVSSAPSEQFWYEELSWSPKLAEDGLPVLAYTKTWRYDEDDVSYTHTYTIKADGSDNQLIQENKEMPVWDFEGERLAFLDLSYQDFRDNSLKQLAVTGISEEVAGPAISPDGNFIIFEVGDENRRSGMARFSEDADNQGVIIGHINVYEPRWSPVPVYISN